MSCEARKRAARNNIAIPWYQEKGFRSVSVKSILKRANLAESHEDELDKLNRVKREMTSIFMRAEHPTTCFDIIQDRSLTLWIVIFWGGLAQFKSKRAQQIYNILFNFSFWLCGAMCAVNLLYKDMPYHVFPTDVLTAYVHLPACQSWVVWRRFVSSSGCEDPALVKRV